MSNMDSNWLTNSFCHICFSICSNENRVTRTPYIVASAHFSCCTSTHASYNLQSVLCSFTYWYLTILTHCRELPIYFIEANMTCPKIVSTTASIDSKTGVFTYVDEDTEISLKLPHGVYDYTYKIPGGMCTTQFKVFGMWCTDSVVLHIVGLETENLH